MLSTVIGPPTARGRRSKAHAPLLSTEVRRSTRSTRYDGFRVPSLSETRTTVSKVKPRLIPSVAQSSSSGGTEIPPPTPIPTMQDIGVHRCAIPPQELSEAMLLSEDVEATQPEHASAPVAPAEEGSASSA